MESAAVRSDASQRLSERLATLDLTKIDARSLAVEVREEALRLLGEERAVVWRYRPALGQLFAEHAGEELRALQISAREARDVLRDASVWAPQAVGIRRRLVEQSFGVAGGAGPQPTLAIPLRTDVAHGLLLVQLRGHRKAGEFLVRAGAFAGQAGALLAAHDELEGARRNEAQLKALYQTAGEISSRLELETVLGAIVERARALAEAPIAYLMLVDPSVGEIFMRVTSGITSPTFSDIRLELGAGLGGMVAQEKLPFYTSDYLNDARFTHQAVVDDEVRREGIKSILGVPLKAFERFVGVLYVADRIVRQFTRGEIDVLMSLAQHAAVAIENASLYERATRALGELEEASRVIQEHNRRLERVDQVHRQLSEIVLAGHGLAGVVNLMTQLVGEPAVVLDEHGRVLAAAGEPTDPFGEQLATRGVDASVPTDDDVRAALARLAELAAAEVEARLPARAQARLVVPIVAGAELLGSVWVETRPEVADEERHLIEQAVRVVGLELLKERSIAEAERRMQHEFLDDLLTARTSDGSALARRAAELGVDLGLSHRLVVVAAAERADASSPSAVGRVKECIVTALRAQPWCAFAGESGRRLVALVRPDQPDLAGELRRLLAETAGPAGQVRAVLSPPSAAVGEFRSHFVAAERVLTVLAVPGQIDEPVVDLDHALFLAMLFRDGGEDELRQFASSRLRPLLALREPRRRELLRTLGTYLEAQMSARRTAAALHVHVNTVYYRLERLRALLGDDFTMPLRALDLQIALLAQRLTGSLAETPKERYENSGKPSVDRKPVRA